MRILAISFDGVEDVRYQTSRQLNLLELIKKAIINKTLYKNNL